MAKKMRVTQHNGRVRKGGKPYSPKHNDRNFDVSKADNIDPERTRLNRYWAIGSKAWYGPDAEKPSFDDVERAFYEKHFMAMYEDSKERSRKRGQLKRVKPFEEWRKARQFIPEETCIQIGSLEDGTVDIDTFKACARDYIRALNEWNRANGKPFTILNVAYHFDEAVQHGQIRKVWHSINPETGIDEIGQEKALERAGVALPHPDEPVGPKNNRKMTFDAQMREKWLDICEKHGLDIERIPEPGRKHNQTKEEYITEKQKAKEKELDEREKKLKNVNQAYSDTYFATTALERKKSELESDIEDMEEFRTWKTAKVAREAQEAAEKAKAEQEARERQEAAQNAAEAAQKVEVERDARAAQEAVQDAQETTPDDTPKSGLFSELLRRSRAAARNTERNSQSGPDFPGF